MTVLIGGALAGSQLCLQLLRYTALLILVCASVPLLCFLVGIALVFVGLKAASSSAAGRAAGAPQTAAGHALPPPRRRLTQQEVEGDAMQLRQLLQASPHGCSPDAPIAVELRGRQLCLTPLGWALLNKRPDTAMALLAEGASPNTPITLPAASLRLTPLHVAVRFGLDACVVALLRAGADPHAGVAIAAASVPLAEILGRTVMALCTGFLSEVLRTKTVERDPYANMAALVPGPHAKSWDDLRQGDSPLVAALMCGERACEAALLGHAGTDVNRPGPGGQTPLATAIARRHPAAAQRLLALPSVDVDAGGEPPLFVALGVKDADIVGQLLRRGAALAPAHARRARNALHVAAAEHVPAGLVRSLLHDSAGGARDAQGAGSSSSGIARLLRAQDSDGNTPLTLAAACGATSALKEFLRALARDAAAPADAPAVATAIPAGRSSGDPRLQPRGGSGSGAAARPAAPSLLGRMSAWLGGAPGQPALPQVDPEDIAAALEAAISSGLLEPVDILLAAGASTAAPSVRSGRTPAQQAVHSNAPLPVVKAVVKAHIKRAAASSGVRRGDGPGSTQAELLALHQAAVTRGCSVQVVSWLRKKAGNLPPATTPAPPPRQWQLAGGAASALDGAAVQPAPMMAGSPVGPPGDAAGQPLCAVCLDSPATMGFVHTDRALSVVHCCVCAPCADILRQQGRGQKCIMCNMQASAVLRVVSA